MTDLADGRRTEVLGARHMDDALALVAEAGWNQTSADWALMMENGHCIGIRDDEGRIIATSLALPMGSAVGWISMVLVAKAERRRGLATRLVGECVAWLEERRITPMLDATPDGAKVYETMGFRPLLGLTRWQHAGFGGSNSASGRGSGLDFVAGYDLSVFGAPRPAVLASLAEGGPVVVHEPGGFLLGRTGRLATQIGPVSADDDERAFALLSEGLAMTAGPVFIDVFDAQADFAARLEGLGFIQQRRFTRMVRGTPRVLGDARRSFAAAGPELG